MSFFKKEDKKKRSLEDMMKSNCDNADSSTCEDDNVKQEGEKLEKEEDTESVKEDFGTSALSCFGWKEDKTEKWLVKCAHVWYGVMSFLWFAFGTLTFAPIIFMQKKINAIFKDKIKSFVISIAIYAVLLALFVFLFAIRGGNAEKEIVEPATTALYFI